MKQRKNDYGNFNKNYENELTYYVQSDGTISTSREETVKFEKEYDNCKCIDGE